MSKSTRRTGLVVGSPVGGQSSQDDEFQELQRGYNSHAQPRNHSTDIQFLERDPECDLNMVVNRPQPAGMEYAMSNSFA